MNIKRDDTDKRTAHIDASDSDSGRNIELIDEQTIRSLEDENTDESDCRFAVVARSLETTGL